MYEITTNQIIQADIASVWKCLIDFSAYPKWNPFILSIDGKLDLGKRLKVIIQSPGMKKMTFEPEIIKFIPDKELRWFGKLGGIPGLFSGEHYFCLEQKEGHTLFTQGEKFSGILVPIFRKKLDTLTRQGFINMNTALAAVCENK